MRTIFLILLLLFTNLYAQHKEGDSLFVIEGEKYQSPNESTYGVTDKYALVVAQHQIYADKCLFFYYGTKIGFVIEDYTADNGFGPSTDDFGLMYKADAGVTYKLEEAINISLEGSHSVNELRQREESLIMFGYHYTF